MSRYIDVEKTDSVIQTELGVYDTTELKEMLSFFPSEDVIPVKHAQWIEDGYFSYDLVCSYCGFNFDIEDSILEHFNYCPHCGAKMDGIKE